MFEAFFASTAVVALAEIGDKTMLLAIVLAARLRAPVAILIAIALGFIAMAAWTLVPDKLDEDEDSVTHRGSAFLTTLVAFFLVEMGDKTQVATIALGAQYHSVLVVAAGTTLGMMLANGPAVFLGEKLVEKVSLKLTRTIAALLFLLLGLWQLAEVLGWLG
jgi:putative Ca2+/H+ antiporter (TMEM165/GDT1 family)